MKPIRFAALLLAVALVWAVGCDREITGNVEQPPSVASNNCFECHSYDMDMGTEVKLAMRQWANSKHASGDNIDRVGSCAPCHTSEGFIEKVTGVELTSGAYNAIGCFTCHDPHENGDFRRRIETPVTLGNGAVYDREESNLCVQCHHGRRDVRTYVADDVELSNHFGPHHNCQSDMLIGENAYEYDGYSYPDSWHATGVEDGCVKCHFDVSQGYILGGHSFNMEYDDEDNIAACNVDGCHMNATEIKDFDRVTAYDFDQDADSTEGVQTEINDLMDHLETLLINAGLLEWIPDAQAWEPTEGLVVPDIDTVGAVFNWAFVHEDKSHGVHNTRYAAALLISSINYMETGDPSGTPAMTRGLLTAH